MEQYKVYKIKTGQKCFKTFSKNLVPDSYIKILNIDLDNLLDAVKSIIQSKAIFISRFSFHKLETFVDDSSLFVLLLSYINTTQLKRIGFYTCPNYFRMIENMLNKSTFKPELAQILPNLI